MTRYIFVTGGVCSGLGKGLAAASIGAILKASGYKVSLTKLDPYLNVDPGTMSPFQHGEVFVTDDGAETDLDLGHYERFIDENLSSLSNTTTGRIYNDLLQKERSGKFLGKTIQIVPHITDSIKRFIEQSARESKADFLIVEIGGTVGDIEGEPYLEAIRQFQHDRGHDNVMFIHLTLLTYLSVSRELKTKPTQASVRDLRRRGIQPDMILARSDLKISKEVIEKISLFCDVPIEAVIPALTVETIYQVPLNFEKYNISQIIHNKFKMNFKKPNLSEWENLVDRIKISKKIIKIGMVGKYTAHGDSYISVNEALKSAGYFHNSQVEIYHIDSEKLEKQDEKVWRELKLMNGILIPGGFGKRGIEGMIMAAKYARENNVPYFGICLGMQIAVIEFARDVLEINQVHSQEFDEKTKHPVIHIMPEQVEKIIKKKEYGATMRLGAYNADLEKGSLAHKAYNQEKISERHRHRYEFNNKYRDKLVDAGLIISGKNKKLDLVEIIEIKKHPWYLGVQFHPEFKSRPLRPHVLFRDFIGSC